MSSLHHPNVVSFYGIVRDGPDGSLATVTEFMVNGSLKQFLQKKDRYGDGTLVNLFFRFISYFPPLKFFLFCLTKICTDEDSLDLDLYESNTIV